MTLFFSSHEITIYRRRRIGSTNRFSMSATFTGYPADIQPAGKERTEMVNGRFGSVFTAFVEVDVDIRENDQVVTADGKRYSVKGMQRWSGAGLLDHVELVLVAQDGY
jgi:hypothetical protein